MDRINMSKYVNKYVTNVQKLHLVTARGFINTIKTNVGFTVKATVVEQMLLDTVCVGDVACNSVRPELQLASRLSES